MGTTMYCSSSRNLRCADMGYDTKSLNQIFVQQESKTINEGLDPKNIKFRECRDSENHPNTVPIILGLDVTGSMGYIPKALIAEGLPKIMTTIIDAGMKDASLCFVAIGDHKVDNYPLQVAQFESGDAELDDWLTKTLLEGGGGGNGGESYHLAWEFASNFVVTDAWEKRKQKGILITIGDEPLLKDYDKESSQRIYDESSKMEKDIVSSSELLSDAKEKWDVYHIFVDNDNYRYCLNNWKEMMGENCVVAKTVDDIIGAIIGIVTKTQLITNTVNKQEKTKIEVEDML